MPPIDWTSVPKVDLHRHLEGALRVETLADIAQTHALDLPGRDVDSIRALVQADLRGRTSDDFLAIFTDLRRFFLSEDIVERIAYEAACDAAADNIRYLELRFNPAALAAAGKLEFASTIDRVIRGVDRAEDDADITVRLLVSFNRAEPDLAEEILAEAIARRGRGIVGIDLAGDEVHVSAAPFVPLFAEAHRAHLGLTAHAGEWAGPESVRFAIEQLGAERIGHGIRIIDDPDVIELAKARALPFEVCITSNVQTGAASSLADHPAPALLRTHQLPLTLNTDDPSVSDITLSGELAVAHQKLGFSPAEVREMTLTAARHAFLEPALRGDLIARLVREFDALGIPPKR